MSTESKGQKDTTSKPPKVKAINEKTREEITQELKAPLPKEAYTTHPTKTFLTSIKSIYVSERLNDVLGVGNWNIDQIEIISENENNGMIILKCVNKFRILGEWISFTCIAGNDNGGTVNKNFDLGDAYKGAISDNLGKIGSWLGIGSEAYKGEVKLSKSSYKPKDSNEPEKEWLNKNTEAYKKAVAYLEKGGDVKNIYAKYKVSKAMKSVLENIK